MNVMKLVRGQISTAKNMVSNKIKARKELNAEAKKAYSDEYNKEFIHQNKLKAKRDAKSKVLNKKSIRAFLNDKKESNKDRYNNPFFNTTPSDNIFIPKRK